VQRGGGWVMMGRWAGRQAGRQEVLVREAAMVQ
jgi:hypothetical protein